jgi:hypothetical protein
MLKTAFGEQNNGQKANFCLGNKIKNWLTTAEDVQCSGHPTTATTDENAELMS